MQNKLIIIGSGAHAKVVLETVQRQGIYNVLGFCVDKISIGEKIFDHYCILDNAMLSVLERDDSISFIVAIGDNKSRALFFENASKKFKPAIIIDPKANISPSSTVGNGCVILSNACINSSAVIGENSIVNISSIVDHDCKIGSNVRLAIGSIIGNNSRISDNTSTNIGEIIQPFSEI